MAVVVIVVFVIVVVGIRVVDIVLVASLQGVPVAQYNIPSIWAIWGFGGLMRHPQIAQIS